MTMELLIFVYLGLLRAINLNIELKKMRCVINIKL